MTEGGNEGGFLGAGNVLFLALNAGFLSMFT